MEMNRTMFLVVENRDALNSLVACFTWVTTSRSTENSPNCSRQRGHYRDAQGRARGWNDDTTGESILGMIEGGQRVGRGNLASKTLIYSGKAWSAPTFPSFALSPLVWNAVKNHAVLDVSRRETSRNLHLSGARV